jgi:hypothetical protein
METPMLFDDTVKGVLLDRLMALEKHLGADVVFYYGIIDTGYAKTFRDFWERLRADSNSQIGYWRIGL